MTYVSADEAWESFSETYFGGSEEAAEGFANDNPLATSDNYEVYLSDVSKQDDVVALAKSLPGVRPDDGENEGVKKSDVVADTLTSVNRLVGYVSAAIDVYKRQILDCVRDHRCDWSCLLYRGPGPGSYRGDDRGPFPRWFWACVRRENEQPGILYRRAQD